MKNKYLEAWTVTLYNIQHTALYMTDPLNLELCCDSIIIVLCVHMYVYYKESIVHRDADTKGHLILNHRLLPKFTVTMPIIINI